jgi:hypothetical protein
LKYQSADPDKGQRNTNFAERILFRAIAAVPAVRYFLAVVGIAAATSLVGALLFYNWKVAFVGGITMLLGGGAVVVFANLVRLGSGYFKWPALILTWTSILLVAATAVLLFTSIFFGKPLELREWLNQNQSRQATSPQPSGKDNKSAAAPDLDCLHAFSLGAMIQKCMHFAILSGVDPTAVPKLDFKAKAWALDDAYHLGIAEDLRPLIDATWKISELKATKAKNGEQVTDEQKFPAIAIVKKTYDDVSERINSLKGLQLRSAFAAGYNLMAVEQNSELALAFWKQKAETGAAFGDFLAEQLPQMLNDYQVNAAQSGCLNESSLQQLNVTDLGDHQKVERLYDLSHDVVWRYFRILRPSYVSKSTGDGK